MTVKIEFIIDVFVAHSYCNVIIYFYWQ